MIGVYITTGKQRGKWGFLFHVDGRTSEVVCRNEIIRIDTAYLLPLDIANTFDELDKLVEQDKGAKIWHLNNQHKNN